MATLDLRASRHDLTITRGQTVVLNGDYGASLVGGAVRASIREESGTVHAAACVITNASAGEYTVTWSAAVTRGMREGRHRWGIEVEVAGIVTPIVHGTLTVDSEVVA